MIEQEYDFSTEYTKWYNKIIIPKKNKKGTRTIYDYKFKRMKKRHKWAIRQIGGNKEFLAFDGLDIIESAKIHKNSNSFIKLDFTSFFDSVNAVDVLVALEDNKRFGQPYFAKLLNEVTDSKGNLLQGTCLSPYFANITLKNLDLHMQEKGEKEGFIYTRYADDILISYEDPMTREELNEKGTHFAQYIQTYTDSNYPSSNISINPSKTEVVTFAIDNHCKVLSWNIIKGKNGYENYITAGRKRRRVAYNKGKRYTAYHSYQTSSFSKNESISANKRRKNSIIANTDISELNPFMFM